MEKIVGVAIKHRNMIYSLPAPNRHHHVLKIMIYPRDLELDIQGFVTNTGRFVDRKEGKEIAMIADQIIKRCGGDDHWLFSENLW